MGVLREGERCSELYLTSMKSGFVLSTLREWGISFIERTSCTMALRTQPEDFLSSRAWTSTLTSSR